MNIIAQPNNEKPLSFDSGLQDIKPCEGAAVALRPIWGKAAKATGLRWQIIAAITKVESDFGCNKGTSSAGAEGWTQFMPGTWAAYGTDADGDGVADPHNAVDAVFSTARYLLVSGAPNDYRKALFAYNRANWYVEKVLNTAKEFGDLSAQDLDESSTLARRVERLRKQATEQQRSWKEADSALKDLKQRERKARSALSQTQGQANQAKRKLNVLGDQVTRATTEYLRLTESVNTASVSEDETLMRFLAESDPRDAALVYASARTLMNSETEALEVLRSRTAQTAVTKVRLDLVAARQTRAAHEIRTTVAEQRDVASQRRERLERTQRLMRSIQRSLRAFNAVAGRDASTGTFTGTIEGDPSWTGAYRWPIGGRVSSKYCERRTWEACHPGIDIAVPEGRAVRASAPGVVSKIQSTAQSGGYGNLVVVDHGNDHETYYAHLSAFSVMIGQSVAAGQMVGRSGNTGRSFGPHVHFEVRRNGSSIDPLSVLPHR